MMHQGHGQTDGAAWQYQYTTQGRLSQEGGGFCMSELFNIPMTKKLFERKLEGFIEYTRLERAQLTVPMPLTFWRTGPKEIQEADEITLLCDPFRGLVLELAEKEKDLLVVVINPKGYEESMTMTEDGMIYHRCCQVKEVDQEAYNALADWLESLEKPAELTTAEDGAGSAGDILPDELETGGKYGTCRDLTTRDVKAIVARFYNFKANGGKLPEFYRQLNITPGEPRSFELETLRGWVKDPRFIPKKPSEN